jgi:hypothetical protein
LSRIANHAQPCCTIRHVQVVVRAEDDVIGVLTGDAGHTFIVIIDLKQVAACLFGVGRVGNIDSPHTVPMPGQEVRITVPRVAGVSLDRICQ